MSQDVAQAFLSYFFDTEKRTPENSEAFEVYSDQSTQRITHANADSTYSEINLEGKLAITQYILDLPPSDLIISFYDSQFSHQDSLILNVIGTQTTLHDGVETAFFRTFILVPTPQGGWYCKTDMLHYQPATQPQPQPEEEEQQQEEVVEVVEVEQPQPEPEPVVVVAAPVIEPEPQPQPEPEQQKQQQEPEPQQQQPQPEPEPVVVAAEEPQQPQQQQQEPTKPSIVESTQILTPPKPAAPVKQAPTSWLALFPKAPEPEVKEEKKEQPKKKAPAPAAAVVEEKKAEVKKVEPIPQPKKVVYPKEQQVLVTNVPARVTKEELLLAFFQLGDVIDTQLDDKKGNATVTFSTAEDAVTAVKAGQLMLSPTVVVTIQPTQKNNKNHFRKQ